MYLMDPPGASPGFVARRQHFMKRSTILTTAAALLLVAGVAQAQSDQRRGRGRDTRAVPAQEQQQRRDDQRQRDTAYKAALANQVRATQDAAAALQQQKRNAQYAVNQKYMANLHQQQEQLNAQRDVRRAPYFSAPMTP